MLWQLPLLKQIRQSGPLNAFFRKGYGPHWGRFKTYEAAFVFLRPSDRLTYQQHDVIQTNIDLFTRIHPYDWPVLFFLSASVRDGTVRTITDFGGHIGVKFYAYQTVMEFPPDLAWQVVDLPEVCREGEKRRTQNASQLTFFHAPDVAPACDLLICSGVLQYSDIELDELIRRLSKKPRFVLLNKVALNKGADEEFYTLEAYGIGRMPYRVLTQGALDKARASLGYHLVHRWSLPYRDFDVPSQRQTERVEMIGEAWTLDSVGSCPTGQQRSPTGRR